MAFRVQEYVLQFDVTVDYAELVGQRTKIMSNTIVADYIEVELFVYGRPETNIR